MIKRHGICKAFFGYRPKAGTRHTDFTAHKRSLARYDKLRSMTARDKLAGTLFQARAATNGAIGRLDSMPLVLRITCLASLGIGIVLLALSIVQVGSIGINDETLSWAEVRTAGYYPFLVICGLAMAVAGIGIWMRRGWSRWLVVLFGVFQGPIEIIYWRNHSQGGAGSPWGYCIGAAVGAGFFYWYLFHKQKNSFLIEAGYRAAQPSAI
jgi:hypothetical protein